VKFACGQQAAAGFVLQAVRQFRREHAGTRLRISTLRGRTRIEGVANGSLDLATVTHEDAAIIAIARRSLHIEPLCLDRLALVCARKADWSTKFNRLPKSRVPAEALTQFPLILPEPDSGLRKGLDKVFTEKDLLQSLDIVLEVGGWHTILTFVREGLGVGLVSEAVLGREEDLLVGYLVPEVFPPATTKLICRRAQGTGEDLDLTEEAKAFRAALRRAVR
jgi:DNA-binding transcriptional LysR family regulator